MILNIFNIVRRYFLIHVKNRYKLPQLPFKISPPLSLAGQAEIHIKWYSITYLDKSMPLYGRRSTLNVTGGAAQLIAVLKALTHLFLMCGFPHDIFLHVMRSGY